MKDMVTVLLAPSILIPWREVFISFSKSFDVQEGKEDVIKSKNGENSTKCIQSP